MRAARLAALLLSAASAAADGAAGTGAFAADWRGITFGEAAERGARSAATAMKLHMMPDKGLQGMGAVCLDGTDAGFYFAPASDPNNTNDWQLYFEGGGWCYDREDCWGRSNKHTGSSKAWPQTASAGGIMSDDCKANPDFCNFNRVYMKYCDGNSFSGNRDDPVVVKGTDGKDRPLYFRGRRILDAILSTLASDHGLADARNVLLTGCSAGGLSTYLHADYVHEQLQKLAPNMQNYKAAPISGFFLLHNTVEDKPVYPVEMKNIFELANSTHGVNDKCIAAMADEDKWKCNFAEEVYAYTTTPMFPLNSALDAWQTICIYASELDGGFPNQTDTANGRCASAAGWRACSLDPEACSASQIAAMNKYITDFSSAMQSKKTYSAAGNGAFVHSCHNHCEAQQGPSWSNTKIDGVTMQQAVSAWWNSDGTDPASKHSYGPCQYKSTWPRKCNPTCHVL